MDQQKTADQSSSIEMPHCHAVVIPQLSRTSVDFYCQQPADRHDCIQTVHTTCFAVHVMFDGVCLIKDFRDANYVNISFSSHFLPNLNLGVFSACCPLSYGDVQNSLY